MRTWSGPQQDSRSLPLQTLLYCLEHRKRRQGALGGLAVDQGLPHRVRVLDDRRRARQTTASMVFIRAVEAEDMELKIDRSSVGKTIT